MNLHELREFANVKAVNEENKLIYELHVHIFTALNKKGKGSQLLYTMEYIYFTMVI